MSAQSEQSKILIVPAENVYSYAMFSCPIQNSKYPGFTWKKTLAYLLVVTALVFQCTILIAIYGSVVVSHQQWVASIVYNKPPQAATIVSGRSGNSTCNSGGSMCVKSKGIVTCAPPSVQLVGRWSELDTNEDGVWTLDEAIEAQQDLQCKYVVDPVEFFKVLVSLLKDREKLIWLHPDVRDGKSIPHTYFQYAAGDLIMCTYRTGDMCPNLLKRGFFDAPMQYGTAPRVGETIQSALEYCYGLLEKGGTCERTLPSTYAVWQKSSEAQCYGPSYQKYVHAHPTSAETTKSILTVDYTAVVNHSRASGDPLFLVFKSIIIMVFFFSMYNQMKDIALNTLWILRYPTVTANTPEVREEPKGDGSEDVKYVIQATTRLQRGIVAFVTAVRFFTVAMLIVIGFTFLALDTDWVNLVLNGVALLFIMDISDFLFTQIVNSECQGEHTDSEPMEVPRVGGKFLTSNPAFVDFVGFLAVAYMLIALMYVYSKSVDMPLATALKCACSADGSSCREANIYGQSFWDKYWRYEVPSLLSDIEVMQGTYDGVSGVPAPASAPATSLLQQVLSDYDYVYGHSYDYDNQS